MTLADSPPTPDSLQPQTTPHPKTHPKTQPPRQLPIRLNGKHDLLHYAAYFVGIASLVFVAQTHEPKQVENALLAGAISAASVVSRDWYKARLDPNMAADPNAFIGLFNEMLQAGRNQANSNTAQLQRVEFLQTDLVEAMRELNDQLRLEPAEVEQRLKAIQTAHLTNALPPLNLSASLGSTNGNANGSTNGSANGSTHGSAAASVTHIPDSTTLRQSEPIRRPGFDA